jgi:colanic acid/amylovoran biosynthesis glycosyltransferase
VKPERPSAFFSGSREGEPVSAAASEVVVAYLINQYPKVSHSFIRSEILALEALGASVVRVAARGWADTVVDPADETERARTRYLLRGGAGGLLVAGIRALMTSPVRFCRAAAVASKMSRMSPRPLHVHLVYLLQASCLLQLCREEGVTHVHAHFGTNPAEVAMLCAELGGPPFSFTVHGPEEFDMPAGLHLRVKVQRAAFVAAISSFGHSQLFRWIPYEQWKKVKVVHCTVDDGFQQAAQPVPADSRSVVCVGRLCEQKGQMLLLLAARELATRGVEFQLVLAGDGEMRPELERLIAANGLGNRVKITGWVSGEEVRTLLLGARALILPSFAEGLPVVIMEAMALGRPVITTRIAGIPELVRDGKEGWLVAAGDCHALVDAWTELLEADADQLNAMGESAQRRVAQRHSGSEAARKLVQMFGGAA